MEAHASVDNFCTNWKPRFYNHTQLYHSTNLGLRLNFHPEAELLRLPSLNAPLRNKLVKFTSQISKSTTCTLIFVFGSTITLNNDGHVFLVIIRTTIASIPGLKTRLIWAEN